MSKTKVFRRILKKNVYFFLPKQRFLEEYLRKMCIFSCCCIVDASASKADRLYWMKSVDDIFTTHSELCFENIC